MESKGKEVVVADPSLKRTRKGKNGASSSASKANPARRFGEKAVEPHGLTWFNTQKEAKYAPENWMDEGRLELEFLTIKDKIRELGVGYIFNKPERSWVVIASIVMLTWMPRIF
ncbi:hypothetical protein HAX54_025456 [Datura stramonium]|uniref:Uncharacterized protein n=1 Tax=Datura stramonium TaxID=4076 RepID=A0ABS8V1I4_DATST|nr:hypothetical protein [Datura stramonium]